MCLRGISCAFLFNTGYWIRFDTYIVVRHQCWRITIRIHSGLLHITLCMLCGTLPELNLTLLLFGLLLSSWLLFWPLRRCSSKCLVTRSNLNSLSDPTVMMRLVLPCYRDKCIKDGPWPPPLHECEEELGAVIWRYKAIKVGHRHGVVLSITDSYGLVYSNLRTSIWGWSPHSRRWCPWSQPVIVLAVGGMHTIMSGHRTLTLSHFDISISGYGPCWDWLRCHVP